MRLGIPRGFFYYDYKPFINKLFQGTNINIVTGDENNENTLKLGSSMTVDEACFPVKLFVGQIDSLCNKCDKVFIPRIMKDCRGRWLCPKLLGIPELSLEAAKTKKLLITEPLYFDRGSRLKKSLWHTLKELDIKRGRFEENFAAAYSLQEAISKGYTNAHVEADWEFVPTAAAGEIILPNTKKVFLAGHCYNIYDKYANVNIFKKLDDLGIEAITEKEVTQEQRERAVESVSLAKEPFWESFIRIFGSAVHLQDQVDGIVYLSSFSCGPDAFIIEMLKSYVTDIPIMVLKLDEHRGEAGLETRVEAFADLLERKKAS